MRAVTKHIDCPEHWQSTNDWDSHRPLLCLAFSKYKNIIYPVVEYGCGKGSTPLISEYCHNSELKFLTIDTNAKYLLEINEDILSYGIALLVKSYSDVRLSDFISILFVDSAPADTRKEIISAHDNQAQVIIVHDTEEGAEYVYGVKEILSTFKYRLDYQPEGKPHTTAVSNHVNVTEWITPV